MRKISMKAYLAAGLSHRMESLDAQLIADVIGGDPVAAVRSNQRVVRHIEEGNKDFMAATKEIYDRKMAVMEELRERHKKETADKSFEEQQRRAKELEAEFNKRAAEIQKESKAQPNVIVDILLGNEDYEQVLVPVFKKTAGTWDMDGKGIGQKIFLEVADVIEAVVES